MVFSTSKFETLSLRPPTPPKDLEESDKDAQEAQDALQFLEDPFGTGNSTKIPLARVIAAKSLLNTPEQSPSSEAGSPSSTGSTKKRVNFELSTCTIPNATLSPQPWSPARSSPLRPLPQTRVPHPLKSILKPSDPKATPPPPDNAAAAHKFKTFAEMLDSVVVQLARDSRALRLDAYSSVQKTMQAYDNLPDAEALIQKMGLLTQFIRRDMQAVGITGSGPDSQLVTQALKFLMGLFRLPEIRQAMDDDFCSFIVDRIILVTADPNMPKTVVNTHLATLMQQNFRPKTMTTARLEKILDVLDTISERISGLSVLAYRIRIYRKLIQQRPDIMTKHTERWFKHCVRALLSTQKDINQSALDTTICAAKTIGNDRHVTKSVLSVLNRVNKDDVSFAKMMTVEMEKMLASDAASLVPQVWAVLTALLRGSLQTELFSAFPEWLKLFQKFTAGSDAVRVHTNVALGFLVYALDISPKTPVAWVSILLKVPQHQFERRSSGKRPERDAATSAYLTLLYYSLRPTASHEQLDRYWRELVADFWNPLIHQTQLPMLPIAACRVVSALLDGSRRPWDEQRALDLRPQFMVQRDELPLLDPKWVRKSLSDILKLVETLLDTTPWTHETSEDEAARTLWNSLLNSLVNASSKEVMASTETKDAMAHIVNLLRRVWDRHTAKLALSQQKEDSWADKFCFLIETVVNKLGALQFADKCLTKNSNNEFEVAPTPTHRSRQQGPRVSPLLYFVDLLVNQSEEKLSDNVRIRALKLMIRPCLDIQNTRLAKLEMLRDCAVVVGSASGATVAYDFWTQVAALTKTCIQAQPSDSNERVSRQFGKEYEMVVDILTSGSSYLMDRPRGFDVLEGFIEAVRNEAGEGALVLAVIERVSERILKPTSEQGMVACLPFASLLLRNLPKQIARRNLDQGRQNLWPSSAAPARNSGFDPYNHFYTAIASVGSMAYHYVDDAGIENTRDFLNALTLSVQQFPPALLPVYLRKIQEAICLWVEDEDKKMQKKRPPTSSLHPDVLTLWLNLCTSIEKLPRKDSQALLHLEPLISAGFLSRRRGIVNASIKTWNVTFGLEKSLRYPARLEEALRRLMGVVELNLPGLEARGDEPTEEPTFYESEDSNAESTKSARTPRIKDSPFKITKSGRKSRSPAVSSTASKRRSRNSTKVRLRHDDSQIQFEPINSSPTDPFNQESQVLTERQKDMIERQRSTPNLFANMGALSSRQDIASPRMSPSILHSDATSADELPAGHARTPLKSLAALGPADMYLGSSPTPHARNRTQHVVSDGTSVATPTVARTVQANDQTEEFGSSPPRPLKVEENIDIPTSSDALEELVVDSFEFRQPDRPYSLSFDEGTTVEEDALREAQSPVEDELRTDPMDADVPGSSLELQLTAQFDAEINAITGNDNLDTAEESNNVYVDARMQQTIETDGNESDTEVDEGVAAEHQTMPPDSFSHITDSFTSQVSDGEKSKSAKRRRSSRNLATSSPAQTSSARKRKQTAGETPGKSKRGRRSKAKKNDSQGEETSSQAMPQPTRDEAVHEDEGGMLDNIVVAVSKRGRKPKNAPQAVVDSQPAAPEPTRKRSMQRSASLLSHVETHGEVVVEDTPTAKRARRSASQDAGQARKTATLTDESQVKRLSHVEVSSRRSSEFSSSARSSSVPADKEEGSKEAVADAARSVPRSTGKPLETEGSQQSQQLSVPMETSNRSFTQRVILTPKSIIDKIKGFTAYISQIALGGDEERDLDVALFHLRREVHDAARRGDHNDQ